MSWASQVQKQLRKQKREQEQRNAITIEHGQIFYDVMILGICRTWRHGVLRSMSDPEEFCTAVIKEMYKVFENPCDYHALCLDETGIEISMED